MKTPTETLTNELLIAIRGNKSQEWLARKVGVSKNQIYRWEKLKSPMKWSSFYKICKAQKLNIRNACTVLAGYEVNSENSSEILLSLCNEIKPNEIQKIMSISRHTFSRVMRGKSEFSLEQLLLVLTSSKTLLIIPFLEKLVDTSKIKSISTFASQQKKEINLTYENPEIASVLRALELVEYDKLTKHKKGIVAALAGISVNEEIELLKKLKDASIINFKDGKYVSKPHGVDTGRRSLYGNLNIKKHWLRESIRFLNDVDFDSIPEKSYFASNVCSVSDKGYKKIKELYFQYFEKCREIVELEKTKPDMVVNLGVQLFDLGERK